MPQAATKPPPEAEKSSVRAEVVLSLQAQAESETLRESHGAAIGPGKGRHASSLKKKNKGAFFTFHHRGGASCFYGFAAHLQPAS
jgi:hypothetical protein